MPFRKGNDGANLPEDTRGTVSDKENDRIVKGIGNLPADERARLAEASDATYQAYLRNGRSD